MTDDKDSFSYTIREGALAKIAATAALETKGVAGKKGRGITVKHVSGFITADIHIQAYYGVQMRTLALTVQKNVARALSVMAAPQQIEVHVTIEDLVKAKDGSDSTGG